MGAKSRKISRESPEKGAFFVIASGNQYTRYGVYLIPRNGGGGGGGYYGDGERAYAHNSHVLPGSSPSRVIPYYKHLNFGSYYIHCCTAHVLIKSTALFMQIMNGHSIFALMVTRNQFGA